MVENIIIGKPLVHPRELLAYDNNDWIYVEAPKTLFTEERNLPRIMKLAGIVSSTSEVRRNNPKLCVELNKLDYLEIKWGKKRLFIVVGG